MKNDTRKGEKKILLAFSRFIETDFFHDEVRRIRTLAQLPENGIKPTEKDLKKLSDIFYVPDNFPIKEMVGIRQPMFTLNVEMRKMAEALPVNNDYLMLLVRGYVLFNRFLRDELEHFKVHLYDANVCKIEDAQSEFDDYAPSDDPDDSFSIREYTNMMENELWKYPVVIRIHPHASQRDITDYIRTHWQDIASYQKLYTDRAKYASFKNSKTKIGKNKERDDFIYENREMSLKKLRRIVNTQFKADTDEGAVGKIISIEKKRRERK